jgi:hypothetical protein
MLKIGVFWNAISVTPRFTPVSEFAWDRYAELKLCETQVWEAVETPCLPEKSGLGSEKNAKRLQNTHSHVPMTQ